MPMLTRSRRKSRPSSLRMTIDADSSLKVDAFCKKIKSLFTSRGIRVSGPIPLPKEKGVLESVVNDIMLPPEHYWECMLHRRVLVIYVDNEIAMNVFGELQVPDTIKIGFRQ